MKKEVYQKPEIEVIEVEMEGVLALSPGGPDNPGIGRRYSDIVQEEFMNETFYKKG